MCYNSSREVFVSNIKRFFKVFLFKIDGLSKRIIKI